MTKHLVWQTRWQHRQQPYLVPGNGLALLGLSPPTSQTCAPSPGTSGLSDDEANCILDPAGRPSWKGRPTGCLCTGPPCSQKRVPRTPRPAAAPCAPARADPRQSGAGSALLATPWGEAARGWLKTGPPIRFTIWPMPKWLRIFNAPSILHLTLPILSSPAFSICDLNPRAPTSTHLCPCSPPLRFQSAISIHPQPFTLYPPPAPSPHPSSLACSICDFNPPPNPPSSPYPLLHLVFNL